MKKSLFPIADVLMVLAALGFGFFCFLGKNFSTLGNMSVSTTWGAIAVISLAGTAFIAKSLKRTDRNFRTNYIFEIVFLLLFTVLIVYFAHSVFSHYFIVADRKAEIQAKLQTGITQAENMFDEYEVYANNRESMYKDKLQRVADSKGIDPTNYSNFNFVTEVPDSIQIEHKMFTMHALLFPPNYSDSVAGQGLKELATDWLKTAKGTADRWKPIGIVTVVNEVEEKSTDWLNQLKGFSQSSQIKDSCQSFNKQLIFADIKKDFTTPGKATPLSIALVALTYLLMLLSYLITKRSTKSPIGIKKSKGKYDVEY